MSEQEPVLLEDFIMRRAGLSGPARFYQEQIASPLTVAVKRYVKGVLTYHPVPLTLEAMGIPGVAEGLGEFAGIMVPQTLTGATLMAATAPLGGATAGIKGLAGAATRTGVLTALGGGVGASTGEGGLVGGVQGAIQGLSGELINKALSYARTLGIDRMAAKARLYDAGKLGETLDSVYPLFGGRRTPQQLYELVMPTLGKPGGVPQGQRLLKEVQEQSQKAIVQELRKVNPQFNESFPLFPGPKIIPGKPMVLSPILNAQGKPIVSQPAIAPHRELLGYTDARHRLTELYNLGYHGIKGDPRLAGLSSAEAKQAYAASVQLFDATLDSVVPGVSQLARTSRTEYRQGMALLDLLEQGFKSFGADEIRFNSDAIMRTLSTPRLARRFAARFQDVPFKSSLTATVFRGQRPGLVDEFNANTFLERIAERIHPAGGLTIAGRLSRPNLVGEPFKTPPRERRAIELGTALVTNQARDVLTPQLPIRLLR